MAPDTHELSLPAAVGNLPQMLAFIESCLDETDCSPKTRMQIAVASEEIFVNIANYAYAPKTGMATVRVELLHTPPAVAVSFIDAGVPFDPLEKPDPDVTLSAAERRIGGLGIFMAKKVMDSVTYEYRNGQNVLVMRKSL